MTKYHSNKYYTNNSDKTIIASEEQIREQDHREKEFICDTCRCKLTRLCDRSGNNVSFYCPRCNSTSYDAEELRSESIIEMSEGPIEEPAASIVPEPALTRKKKEVKGGLKTLQDKGIKVTYYKEGKG
jgi:Zn-finger nucleic acid-binding protein